MNPLSLLKTERKPSDMSLEETLIEMARYGKPSVSQVCSDGTWYSSIDVTVNASGVKFEVESDFKQTSPGAAVAQCYERLMTAIEQVNSVKPS